MSMSQIFGDGSALIDTSFFSLQHRELASQTLLFHSLNLVSRDNDKLNVFASLLSDSSAQIGQIVLNVVSVDFLKQS